MKKVEITVLITTQHSSRTTSFKLNLDENDQFDLDDITYIYDMLVLSKENRIPVEVLYDILVNHGCHTYLIKECGKPMQYTFVLNKVKFYED